MLKRSWGAKTPRRPPSQLAHQELSDLSIKLDAFRKKDFVPAGLISKNLRPGIHYECWNNGKAIFEQNGIAVIVGLAKDDYVPLSIVTKVMPYTGEDYLIIAGFIEGVVKLSDSVSTSQRLIEIAARLSALKLGGWKLTTSFSRCINKNLIHPRRELLSDSLRAGNLINPLNSELTYELPDFFPTDSNKNAKLLRRLLTELEELPDSPLLLYAAADQARKEVLDEWVRERKNDVYERLALARWPTLDIKEILLRAERARESKLSDPILALESVASIDKNTLEARNG
jgi:hypothetical protein